MIETKLTITVLYNMCSVCLQWYPYFLAKWITLSLSQKSTFILTVKSKKLFMTYSDTIVDEDTFEQLRPWICETNDMEFILTLLKFATPFQLCQYYCFSLNNKQVLNYIFNNYSVVQRFTNIKDHLDEFPTEFFCLVQNLHDVETQMIYCWHHNILQYPLRNNGRQIMDNLNDYPIAKQILLIETAVSINVQLPEHLEPHMAFVANLNLIQKDMKPRYSNFEIWSYCPVVPSPSVIDYIASLPLPEGGYPAHSILSRGSYILDFHPELNVLNINEELFTHYSYLIKKYSLEEITDYVKQMLVTDTADTSYSLAKNIFPRLIQQQPFYTKYICLYYLLNVRIPELTNIDLMCLTQLDKLYLLKLKEIKNINIINMIKSVVPLRQILAPLIPEYRQH
jgi:hypothetical protein